MSREVTGHGHKQPEGSQNRYGYDFFLKNGPVDRKVDFLKFRFEDGKLVCFATVPDGYAINRLVPNGFVNRASSTLSSWAPWHSVLLQACIWLSPIIKSDKTNIHTHMLKDKDDKVKSGTI
jgi:hypothetical protein